MAKKFVRGITDIKEINKQDFDTNNVNDLLSDGAHNYIHRKKKDNSEEYHNLTNNLKTITSDNTDLLSVTNDNNSTNSATVHPKHDTQKEQTIESTRNTITIEHGENATTETTKVDTNPQKVLEHENLLTNYGILKTTSGNTLNLSIECTRVPDGFDLNTLLNGRIRSSNLQNAPHPTDWFLVTAYSEGNYTVQEALKLTSNNTYVRRKNAGVWGEWSEQAGDMASINDMLAQKQGTLSTNNSIAVLSNNELRQLFYNRHTYAVGNGFLKTHARSVSENTDINTPLEEFNFTVKIKQNVQNISVTLTQHDVTAFTKIMNTYGSNNTVRISGCVFTLNGTTLTVSTTNNTQQNYVITFSDII